MNSLISIVIPIYKVENYIERCIKSIINQTYKFLEIILVDDGSPDDCGIICDQYAEIDSRITVIHQENKGLSGARNSGIDIAQGEFITFIDSDDWVCPDYIEILYNNLVDHSLDISICNYIDVSSYEIDQIRSNNQNVNVFTNLEALEQYFTEFSTPFVVSWGKLYKVELFENIRFPEGKIHEDEFTTYQLLFNAKKIGFINEPLYYYFQRNDSIMGNGFNIKGKNDCLEALEQRIDFYKRRKLKSLRTKTYNTYCRVIEDLLINHKAAISIDEYKSLLKKYKNISIKLLKSKHIKNRSKIRIFVFIHFRFLSKIWRKKYDQSNKI
ncbi:glycosyltransferase family 2 protein [Eubacterium limosum]|uniref:glycosyltransferase family 2 protein n=1 Tax=Eubacterium limosum TaxID=1736 RepID=UPI0022E57375|nr:glycosyltransferase [Eubacterium limosum]